MTYVFRPVSFAPHSLGEEPEPGVVLDSASLREYPTQPPGRSSQPAPT